MSIQYSDVIDGKMRVTQKSKSPLVYLDIWALNHFLMNHDDKTKFVNILNDKKGSLVATFATLMEVVDRGDESQKIEIARLLDSVDTVFMDGNFIDVIEREKHLLVSGGNIFEQSPWCDYELVKRSGLHNDKTKLTPLKPAEILELAIKEFKDGTRAAPEPYQNELMPKIKKARNDKESLDLMKKGMKNKKKLFSGHPPYTKALSDYCIMYVISHENMEMPVSEWHDLTHTIVPVSYCDFVLLDRRWNHFVKTTGLEYPDIAKIYKSDEIEKFMDDLSEYKNNSRWMRR